MYTIDNLASKIEQELQSISYPATPALLYEPIRYSLRTAGKRIRPVALLIANDMFGGKIESALPAAMAIEVFHNFTLLHDDIMDNAPTRRGKPAVHTKWNANVAILSGDAMLIQSYRLLSQCDSLVLARLMGLFNDLATGVCEGQQYDMDFEHEESVSVAQYLQMIELKTAVLLAGSLRMGAVCAGASAKQELCVYNFGIGIGLAFQLQDDLLDTYADPSVFGKNIGGDILSGKKTFLLTNALEKADSKTKQELLTALHTGGDAEKITAVTAIYDKLQIRELTQQRVEAYFEESLRELSNLETEGIDVSLLRSMAFGLLNRQK